MREIHIIPKESVPENRSFIIRKLTAPYFDPTFHLHPEFQLCYIIEGTGNRLIGDTISPFTSGDLVLLGPNLPHVWRNHDAYFEKGQALKTSAIVIYFDDHLLGESIYKKEEFEKIKHLFKQAECGIEITGDTRTMVSRLMQELLDMKGTASVIQLLKILDTIGNANEYHLITDTHATSYNTVAETDRMNKIFAFTMQNFRRKIYLEEAASIAGMTCTSFSRYFKSRVNQSYSDFLKEIRIEHACKLLKEDKMGIDLIGRACGFKSVTNFNRQFKEVMGKCPHQYRRAYKKMAVESYYQYHSPTA